MKQLTGLLKAALTRPTGRVSINPHYRPTSLVVFALSNGRQEQSDFRNKAPVLLLKPVLTLAAYPGKRIISETMLANVYGFVDSKNSVLHVFLST